MKKREDIDIGYFKNRLGDELSLVEKELENVGRKNPDNTKNYEAEPTEFNN